MFMGGNILFHGVSEHVVSFVPFLLLLSPSKLIFDFFLESLGNLFIAGTSCKDFSMLKSSHRKGKTINQKPFLKHISTT